MARSRGRPGTYTATGWRIVGAGAAQVIREAPPAELDRLRSGQIEDTLCAVDCTLPAVVEGRITVERVLDAITEEIRRSWPECPRLRRDEMPERRPARLGGLRTRHHSTGDRWSADLLWRAVHPMIAGAPTTTRVTLEERATWVRLGVRVTCDEGLQSVRGDVGAGQATPRFLQSLRSSVPFTWLGGPLKVFPVRPGDEEDFVQSVLASPTRSYPVAVLSPLEDGGYVVEPQELMWELLGRARLYVFQEHRQTFKLTDLVRDKRMSCFWGAARCYLPMWSIDDDPLEHPLLLSDRLADPVMRAAWLGEIGRWHGQTITLPAWPDEEDEAPPRSGRPSNARDPEAGPTDGSRLQLQSPDGTAGREQDTKDTLSRGDASAPAPSTPALGLDEHELSTAAVAMSSAPSIDGLEGGLRQLMELVRRLVDTQGALRDEVERLRTLAAVRSSSTNAIERRLGRLETLLERMFEQQQGDEGRLASLPDEVEEVDDGDEGRLSLVDVVRTAAETHSDALLFLDSVSDAAAESPYEDPERVKAILDAMAGVARQRGDGSLGTSLREAFNDLGIDYRGAISSTTSARLRQQYEFLMPEGDRIQTEEHIVLGNTYDPRRCLRIYFSSRVPTETRFVIGHVGRHFEVRSSS